jgi:tRNA(His) 5'-end guanylyltransferase
MKESKISSLSSADIAFYEQLADETMADLDAKAAAMTDRQVYDYFSERRKKAGISSISFEEFWGHSEK